MSQDAFDAVLMRMAEDPTFAESVRLDADTALAGLDLTPSERDRLRALRADETSGGAAELEERLSKSSLIFGASGNAASAAAGHDFHGLVGGLVDQPHSANAAAIPGLVDLNPQPLPPLVHPNEVAGALHGVELNPQPLPPGMAIDPGLHPGLIDPGLVKVPPPGFEPGISPFPPHVDPGLFQPGHDPSQSVDPGALGTGHDAGPPPGWGAPTGPGEYGGGGNVNEINVGSGGEVNIYEGGGPGTPPAPPGWDAGQPWGAGPGWGAPGGYAGDPGTHWGLPGYGEGGVPSHGPVVVPPPPSALGGLAGAVAHASPPPHDPGGVLGGLVGGLVSGVSGGADSGSVLPDPGGIPILGDINHAVEGIPVLGQVVQGAETVASDIGHALNPANW